MNYTAYFFIKVNSDESRQSGNGVRALQAASFADDSQLLQKPLFFPSFYVKITR
jgi:hypothetical protein